MSEHKAEQDETKENAEDVVGHGDIAWDEYHCNPRAEVVLVSSDMVGFRVEAWYISKKSDFVRDLLKFPSTQPIADAPIYLPRNSETVRHYVDYVTSAKDHDLKLDLVGFQHLLDLCDYLHSPGIEQSVLGAMKTRMEYRDYPVDFDPWNIFALAARRNNADLAQCAIGCFDRADLDIKELLAGQPPSFYDNIPSRYFHALLRSAVYPATAYETRKGYSREWLAIREVEQMVGEFSLD